MVSARCRSLRRSMGGARRPDSAPKTLNFIEKPAPTDQGRNPDFASDRHKTLNFIKKQPVPELAASQGLAKPGTAPKRAQKLFPAVFWAPTSPNRPRSESRLRFRSPQNARFFIMAYSGFLGFLKSKEA